MDDSKDPLEALISNDARTTDRKKLADLLAPYLVIDRETNEFGFNESFDDLKGNDLKIELLLAGAKARSLLFDLADGLSPSEIIATGIMAEGSVKTSLKRLFDKRKLRKDKDGRYVLPSHRVSELAQSLAE